jgi:hypothetical protein
MRKEEMEKVLNETRSELDRLMLRMHQGEQGSWGYEWPMKQKVKWLVQQLISRRQKKVLRRWLRQVENISDREEEEMVYICRREDGENLGDEEERSTEYITDFQEGNEGRSIEDIKYFHEGRK